MNPMYYVPQPYNPTNRTQSQLILIKLIGLGRYLADATPVMNPTTTLYPTQTGRSKVRQKWAGRGIADEEDSCEMGWVALGAVVVVYGIGWAWMVYAVWY